MPVIKSAIKKLRRDRKREKENDAFRHSLDRAIRLAKKSKSAKAVSDAVSIVDRAVKKNVIHKNRAARIKSSLSKLARPERTRGTKPVSTKSSKSVVKKPTKLAKKPASKKSK